MEITLQDRQAIEDILDRRAGIVSMQEQIREDIKAVAERMGVKPAKLNRIIALVEKERDTGSEIGEQRETLDTAEALSR